MRITGTLLAAFVLWMVAPTLAHAEPSGKQVCKTELASEKADCRTAGKECKDAVKAQHEACVAAAATEEDLLGCTMDRQIGISDCGADYEACTAAAKFTFGLCLEDVGGDPTKQCTDDCDGRLVVNQVKCDVEFDDSCIDEDCVGTEDECTDPVCKEKVETLLTECLDHATDQHARCIESCGGGDPPAVCPCADVWDGPPYPTGTIEGGVAPVLPTDLTPWTCEEVGFPFPVTQIAAFFGDENFLARTAGGDELEDRCVASNIVTGAGVDLTVPLGDLFPATTPGEPPPPGSPLEACIILLEQRGCVFP